MGMMIGNALIFPGEFLKHRLGQANISYKDGFYIEYLYYRSHTTFSATTSFVENKSFVGGIYLGNHVVWHETEFERNLNFFYRIDIYHPQLKFRRTRYRRQFYPTGASWWNLWLDDEGYEHVGRKEDFDKKRGEPPLKDSYRANHRLLESIRFLPGEKFFFIKSWEDLAGVGHVDI